MRIYPRALGANLAAGLQQVVVYAFLTAVFIVLLSKTFSNGTMTISWKPHIIPACAKSERQTFISKEVVDHGVIKFAVPDELKKTKIFENFQKRKRILDRSCTVARRILNSREQTHSERLNFQKQILDFDVQLPDETLCVPRLADKSQKQEHFFNDTFKFSVCLPTKTGCTNWQRGLVSLVKMGEKTPEELDDSEIFYDLDRYPKIGMGKDRSTRGPSNGYLTMVNVRHPFSRLLSAYRDKFRKGHPWMKIVEPKFGFVLKKFEKKNMEVEMFEYSFPAFLELAAASEYDFERDQHWRTMTFHCGPCNNEFDFVVHQEQGSEEQEFILKAMNVAESTHIPGKYTTALKGYDDVIEFYKGIPKSVLEQLYKIYYSDFVFFGYEIDDFYAVAIDEKPDDPIHEDRKWAKMALSKKFFIYKEKFHENECDESFNVVYEDAPQ